MKKVIMILVILVPFLLSGIASAAWSQKWHYDTASPDYESFWQYYYPSVTDRIKYVTSIMPLCADVINNGNGPSGKPILEVFLPSGPNHGTGICPVCGGGSGSLPHISGSVTCLNGATGEFIWRHVDNRIFVQSKIELADFDDDGDLELFVNCYHGYMLLDAATGNVIWDETRTPRTDKFSVFIRDPRETVNGNPNPDYDKVFLYQSMGASPVVKRNSLGVIVAQGIYSEGPCFGGLASADMNNDGIPEIVEHTYTPGSRFCYDLDLNLIWQDSSAGGGGSVPVLYDVNGDGWLDVIVTSGQGTGWRLGVLDGYLSWQNGVGTYMVGKGQTLTGLAGHNAPTVVDLGDGNLLAFTTHVVDSNNGAWNLETWQLVPIWDNTKIDLNWDVIVGNVYGDSQYLEVLGGFAHNRVYDYQGNLVSSCSGQGSSGGSPQLIADIDGDNLNEVITWGSNIFTVQNTPWGNPYNVWSNGWFVCWDTDATALNPYQAVYSQFYSARRLGAEIPTYEPLWWSGSSPPPPPPEPSITLLSPDGGESWELGSTVNIVWSHENFDDDVIIELYKGTQLVLTIINVNNDNSYSWAIPSNLAEGINYHMKIIDSADPSVYDEGGDFELVNPPQPQEVRCWKCENENAEYYDFPEGTTCGEGNALEYPFNILPNCVTPINNIPGFELVLLVFAILIILRRKKK